MPTVSEFQSFLSQQGGVQPSGGGKTASDFNSFLQNRKQRIAALGTPPAPPSHWYDIALPGQGLGGDIGEGIRGAAGGLVKSIPLVSSAMDTIGFDSPVDSAPAPNSFGSGISQTVSSLTRGLGAGYLGGPAGIGAQTALDRAHDSRIQREQSGQGYSGESYLGDAARGVGLMSQGPDDTLARRAMRFASPFVAAGTAGISNVIAGPLATAAGRTLPRLAANIGFDAATGAGESALYAAGNGQAPTLDSLRSSGLTAGLLSAAGHGHGLMRRPGVPRGTIPELGAEAPPRSPQAGSDLDLEMPEPPRSAPSAGGSLSISRPKPTPPENLTPPPLPVEPVIDANEVPINGENEPIQGVGQSPVQSEAGVAAQGTGDAGGQQRPAEQVDVGQEGLLGSGAPVDHPDFDGEPAPARTPKDTLAALDALMSDGTPADIAGMELGRLEDYSNSDLIAAAKALPELHAAARAKFKESMAPGFDPALKKQAQDEYQRIGNLAQPLNRALGARGRDVSEAAGITPLTTGEDMRYYAERGITPEHVSEFQQRMRDRDQIKPDLSASNPKEVPTQGNDTTAAPENVQPSGAPEGIQDVAPANPVPDTPVAAETPPEPPKDRLASVAPDHPDLTSARKVMVNWDRAARGFDEIPSPEREEFKGWVAEARKSGLSQNAGRLVEDALSSEGRPKAFSPVETAALVDHTAKLKDEYETLTNWMKDDSLSEAAREDASVERDRVEMEHEAATRAIRQSGTEKGRDLVSQKLALDKDFNLVSVLTRARIRKGSALTEGEREAFTRQTEELKAKEAEIERLTKERENAGLNEIVKGDKRASKKAQRTKDQVESDLKSQVEKARELLRAGCLTQ